MEHSQKENFKEQNQLPESSQEKHTKHSKPARIKAR